MGLCRLVPLISIAVGFYSGPANALELGEITLKSHLNQPLIAHIELSDIGNLADEDIKVVMASRKYFELAEEFNWLPFLDTMQMDVVLDDPANPHIRVETPDPATQSSLDFILDVKWPSGRIIREYNVSLDLPAVETAEVGTTVPAPDNEAIDPQEQQLSSLPAEPLSYRVQSGDTLIGISRQLLPNVSISINQFMIAIQRANPDVFVDNNINLLLGARTLQIPGQTDIETISRSEATALVTRQNQDWMEWRDCCL